MSKEQYELIPIEKLTKKEKKVVDKLLVAFLQTGDILKVSQERTEKIIEIAQENGLSKKDSKRIASHFNAASNMVNGMTRSEKEITLEKIKAKDTFKF